MTPNAHILTVKNHPLLVHAEPGREIHGPEGVTRFDTVFVSEIRRDPKDASPTGHRRGLMHFDIRVHENHSSREREITFPQKPVFPINQAQNAPAIVQSLQTSLAAQYKTSQAHSTTFGASRIRGYSLRSDLNSEKYPWIDLHPDEFALIVDHLQTQALGASREMTRALEWPKLHTRRPHAKPAKPHRKKPRKRAIAKSNQNRLEKKSRLRGQKKARKKAIGPKRLKNKKR